MRDYPPRALRDHLLKPLADAGRRELFDLGAAEPELARLQVIREEVAERIPDHVLDLNPLPPLLRHHRGSAEDWRDDAVGQLELAEQHYFLPDALLLDPAAVSYMLHAALQLPLVVHPDQLPAQPLQPVRCFRRPGELQPVVQQ